MCAGSLTDDRNGFISVAISTFTEAPKNLVLQSKSPEAIVLGCKSDCQCNLKWFVKKESVPKKEQLYNGYTLSSEAKSYITVIADEPGKYYLNLTNKPDAAQTYICLEPGSLAEVSADVIWIGKFSNFCFSAT